MKVCIFGCGYLGLTIACGLAQIGHNVYCIDKNDYRTSNVKKGILDIYEPNIEKSLLKNMKQNKLRFYEECQFEDNTDIYIIAVGTTQDSKGELNIENVKSSILSIITSINKYSVILIKTTLSIGDCKKLKQELKDKAKADFDIVYNPEFFAQGTALKDFLNPKRIILGTTSKKALKVVKRLYAPLEAEIISMDENSAELVKLASDAFLATKISFINEIANLASKTNSNIHSIQKALSKDEKIGVHFLKPGIGYGGSAIPKNINTILKSAQKYKVDLNIIKHTKIANENQKRQFLTKIFQHYNYNLENKVFCIWGLSYKPNTSDTREAPSNTVIDTLLRYGAIVRAYDPHAQNSLAEQYRSKEDALLSSNALIILTDWDEFLNPDFEFISKNLADKVIFDGRNIYINKNLKDFDLKYYYIGKNDE